MFRRLLACLPCFFCAVVVAQPLSTAFTFQGQLKATGTPASGTYDLRFRLYDAVSAGAQIGPTLCSDNIAITAGTFTTQLDFGAQFAGQQRFLEIDIRQDTGQNCSNASGFTTLSPRQPLSAAPNAIYSLAAATASNAATATNATNAATAANATQFNGQPATFYTNAANLSGTLPSASLTGTYAAALNLSNPTNLFSGSFAGNGSGLTNIPWSNITGTPALVQLQPTSPGTTQTGNLNISGPGVFGGLFSTGPLTFPSFSFLDGDLLRIDNGRIMGLSYENGFAGGIINLDVNFRMAGHQTGLPGAAVRIDSRLNVPPIQLITRPRNSTVETTSLDITEQGQVNIRGATPDALTVTNTAAGRGMHIIAPSDTAIWADTTSGFAGLDARNASTSGRAIIGQALASTGTNYGVIGQTSSPTGYGVYSSGNTGASGSKAFRIDHPADPQHKYLLHYSTESPEVLNSYRGTVTLNAQGEATIDLPDYFARINKDPSYTLTAIGAPMPLLHIAEEVSDSDLEAGAKAAPTEHVPTCSFRIAGGAPNAKVSWRIEAVRNDRWTQAHGAPVEVNKEGTEDGTYQHPDLYNQPAAVGLNTGPVTR